MDTLSVSGYAIYRSPIFTPAVSHLVQPVVKPAAGTRGSASIGWVILDIQRLVATYTISR
jgi:hypothetical protein